MTYMIDGERGPYSVEEDGGYGKNAACNLINIQEQAFKALEQGNPKPINQLRQSIIRYSAPNKLAYNDVFAFVQQQIHYFNPNNPSGTLNLDALTRIFLGNQELARQYLLVVDRNADGEIDAVDYSAFILFCDDASNLIADTMLAYSNSNEEALFDDAAKEELNWVASWIRTQYPTEANGQITPLASAAADLAVLNFPIFVGVTLDAIREQLKLSERYQAFQAA